VSKIFCILWTVSLLGCSGGSVGTDNPQITLTWLPIDHQAVDTVRIVFWGVGQDVRLNPEPLWDTVVMDSSGVTLNPEGLSLPDQWVVQTVTEDGRVGIIQASLVDSLIRVRLIPTTRIVLLDTTHVLPWDGRKEDSQPITSSDTLKIISTDQEGDIVYSMISTSSEEITSVRYIQVLGTAILLEVLGGDITLHLGTGRYILLYLDQKGQELNRQEIVIP